MKLVLSLMAQSFKRYPGHWLSVLVLVLLTACLWVIEPLYSSSAVDQLLKIADGEEVNLWRIFGWWGLIFLGLSVTQAFGKFLEWKLAMKLELDATEEAFDHVLKLPIAFHTQQKSGEAMKVIEDGSTELAYVSRIIIDFIPSILSSIAFLIISLTIQPILAAILLVSMTLYSSIIIFGSIKTMKLQERANKAWVKPTGRAFDVLTNIFTVKSAGHEDRELERMHRGHTTVMKWQLKVNKRWAFIEALNFFMLTRILIIGIGIILFVKQILTLGEVYYFQNSFYRVLVPFEILANALPGWNKSLGKIRMARNLFTINKEEHDHKGTKKLKDMKGEVIFKNVGFTYGKRQTMKLQADDDEDETLSIDAFLEKPAKKEAGSSAEHQKNRHEKKSELTSADESAIEPPDVLHDVDLHVQAGEHIALVGHSGAGKSTIAMLINRFYDPTKGAIFIDGVNMKDMDIQWWRSQIGLVLQDNVMFNDSLLENIRYARPNASEKDIIQAAKRASAHEFIEKLPGKYLTMVGERGIKLSGGERQRIAIARAILKNPAIVVLDEATSALDSLTEKKVQEGIKELIEGRTSFIIAHRLSTVRSVDRIAVVEAGEITACAPHEELLKTSRIYKEMVDLQKEGILAE